MRIVFRTDASTEIGTGHVMRCLTLADALKERGADVSFICRAEPGNMNDYIRAKGYGLLTLPSGASTEEDADRTIQLLKGFSERPAWLIADHYGLDRTWEAPVRQTVGKILAIDDLADRTHDCDMLLDQNYAGPSRYDGLVPGSCARLIGPRYAMLRPQFARERKTMRDRTGDINRILVFLGGVDSGNETGKVLRALRILDEKDIRVDVVIGASSGHRDEIERMASAMPRVQCHTGVENMAALMSAADISIGAGGTATWERLALGLPSLVIAIADNQVAGAQALARDGYILYAGWHEDITVERLRDDLAVLMRYPHLLRQVSLKAQELVDGLGTERVVNHLLTESRPLRLRPARSEDGRLVFEWRNHPDIRKYSFDPSSISRENHERWFAETISSQDTALLIAEQGDAPVGVLRYDFKGDDAFISVYAAPHSLGKGLGQYLITAGNAWVRANRPEIRRVVAEIKPENRSSVHAFRNAGFQERHLVSVYRLRDGGL